MSYNTSVQLGQTAFLICKVSPGTESVSKLSYRISFAAPTPIKRNVTNKLQEICHSPVPSIYHPIHVVAEKGPEWSQQLTRSLQFYFWPRCRNYFSASLKSVIQMRINERELLLPPRPFIWNIN